MAETNQATFTVCSEIHREYIKKSENWKFLKPQNSFKIWYIPVNCTVPKITSILKNPRISCYVITLESSHDQLTSRQRNKKTPPDDDSSRASGFSIDFSPIRYQFGDFMSPQIESKNKILHPVIGQSPHEIERMHTHSNHQREVLTEHPCKCAKPTFVPVTGFSHLDEPEYSVTIESPSRNTDYLSHASFSACRNTKTYLKFHADSSSGNIARPIWHSGIAKLINQIRLPTTRVVGPHEISYSIEGQSRRQADSGREVLRSTRE